MGDHPPRGRTKELITSKASHIPARNLGKGQLTIAGTAYVIKQIENGKELEELDLREGLNIEVSIGGISLSVELPYTFPYEDGKPVLPPDYADVILRKSLIYEENPCSDD